LIDGGRLVAEGTVEELIVRAGRWTRVDLTYRGALAVGWDRDLGAQDIRVLANGHGSGRLSLELPTHARIEGVLDRVRAAGGHVLDFNLHSTNLADAFVALTGRTLQEPADG
jgi:hypothetical protein